MLPLILPVVLPLLAAFLVMPLARMSALIARALGPIVLTTSLVLLLPCCLDPPAQPLVLAIGNFAPPLGIVFYGDRLALLFANAVALFFLLFWDWRGGNPQQARQDALMLLLAASATGLALSGDLFNLYVFYELAAVASFGLVSLSGTGPALVATVRYLLVSAFGSVLALAGIALLYLQTGTLNLAQLGIDPEPLQGPAGLLAFGLMVIGFGVKAELFPLNYWVPEVYASAPARISALLAGLISKLAVLILLRLLVLVYGDTAAPQILLFLGILTIFFGEFSAWRAQDFPRMIAFSSIGQLGLVFIAFSLSGSWGVLAGIAVALHHLLVKSALFGLAHRWSGSLQALTGSAQRTPLAAALFVLFALSLIGVPPLPGFWTKILVLAGLAQEGSALAFTGLGAILLVTAVEAHYLFRFALQLYEKVENAPAGFRSFWEFLPSLLLGAALLAVTLRINPVADRLRAITQQAADRSFYITQVFPQAAAHRKDQP